MRQKVTYFTFYDERLFFLLTTKKKSAFYRQKKGITYNTIIDIMGHTVDSRELSVHPVDHRVGVRAVLASITDVWHVAEPDVFLRVIDRKTPSNVPERRAQEESTNVD